MYARPIPTPPPRLAPDALNMDRLRGILAERRIRQHAFAAACGLSTAYMRALLSGARAGELARAKVARGCLAYGIDLAAVEVPSDGD